MGATRLPNGNTVINHWVNQWSSKIDPATAPEDWEKQYIELFATMRPGVTLLLVHLTDDGPEERAAFREHAEYGLAWRLRDDALARSGALREMARWHGVTVISWADLARVGRIC